MSGKIERDFVWIDGKCVPLVKVFLEPCDADDNAAWEERNLLAGRIEQMLAAPVVERQPTGQWRIPVNGDWFYGTKEQCERERAEYETTFTAEDYAEAGVVLPEQIWSSPPASVAVVLPERFPDTHGLKAVYCEGWNACLDKVKELNQ